MGKGEIARDEQFLLFPQCFQKACFPGASKGVIVWEWVKIQYLTTALGRILFSLVVILLVFHQGVSGLNLARSLYFCSAFIADFVRKTYPKILISYGNSGKILILDTVTSNQEPSKRH